MADSLNSATIEGAEAMKLLANVIEAGLESVMNDLGWPDDQSKSALDAVLVFAERVGVDQPLSIILQGSDL